MGDYLKLEDLKIYKISRELSSMIWDIYMGLGMEYKIIFGQQFVKSVDSVGANIAEGYGRYHYLDKIRFYYNARASLLESLHWNDLFYERNIIYDENYNLIKDKLETLHIKLNAYIRSIKNKKFNS